MTPLSPFRLTYAFATLPDPRVRGRCDHRLLDIVVMAWCAVIARCDDWQQIALFARERRDWFARFLPLTGGTPSHDTFERVFDHLDPAAFHRCFQHWARAACTTLEVPHIAIDGKALRASSDGSRGLRALHLVSAWATGARLSLGQVAVDSKSNEITAIPRLLELLDLKGALVSIDAMGCQKEIAQQIVAGGGDYVLAVKANQGRLLEDVQACITEALEQPEAVGAYALHETMESGHGRVEKRCTTIVPCPKGIRDKDLWPDLMMVALCTSERTEAGVTGSETRCFISSATLSAAEFAAAVRGHWGIENQLHWHLDVTFREDANRVSQRHGAENLALVRKWAVGLLGQEGSKGSMACKRLRAALSPAFLEDVLRSCENLGKV